MSRVSDNADLLRRFAAVGLSQKSAAERTGVHPSVLSAWAKAEGVKFKHGNRTARPDARSMRMATLYRAGRTLEEIGQEYGITRERVRQIITRHHGLNGNKGGARVGADRKKAERAAAVDAKYLAKWGCTRAQHHSLLLIGRRMMAAGGTRDRSPIGAFIRQRHNAGKRGIEWQLTLWQWWTIWQESGHWEQRGRGNGYVMARVGDSGPYSAENVYITTAVGNLIDSLAVRGLVWSGLPTGVTRVKCGYRASRSINGKKFNLGIYQTSEEAHAAYLASAPQNGVAA